MKRRPMITKASQHTKDNGSAAMTNTTLLTYCYTKEHGTDYSYKVKVTEVRAGVLCEFISDRQPDATNYRRQVVGECHLFADPSKAPVLIDKSRVYKGSSFVLG